MHTRREKRIYEIGISAVEVLVGVSILALILVFVTYGLVRLVDTGRLVAERTEALYLAEEGMELIRFVRDGDWDAFDNLTSGTTYYLDIDPTTIAFTSTPESIDEFTRSFEVEPVERNTNDDIVASGTNDSGSSYVTVTVSWDGGIESVSLTSMLGNIQKP